MIIVQPRRLGENEEQSGSRDIWFSWFSDYVSAVRRILRIGPADSREEYDSSCSVRMCQCLDYRDACVLIGVAKHSGKRPHISKFCRAFAVKSRHARVSFVGVMCVRPPCESEEKRGKTEWETGRFFRRCIIIAGNKIGCAAARKRSLPRESARARALRHIFYYRSKSAVLLLNLRAYVYTWRIYRSFVRSLIARSGRRRGAKQRERERERERKRRTDIFATRPF